MRAMKFSLIMPFYDNSNCIVEALKSVVSQNVCPEQILIIDDYSPTKASDALTDLVVIESLNRKSIELCVFRKNANGGLAAAYNTGLGLCKNEIVVLMHPDVVLPDNDSMKTLLAPFESADIALVGHVNCQVSDDYWHERTLCEKSILAPSESRRARGFNGQFDAFRKSIAVSIGGFNEAKYRTAGEDGDFVRKMLRVGKYVNSEARAEHRHDFQDRSGIGMCLRKSFQYGNAQGASVREGGGITPLFREAALLVGVVLISFDPNLAWVSIGIWLLSGIRIPYLVFRRDRRLFQGVCLVAIEFMRLFAHASGVVVGCVKGRQTI